MLTKTDLTFIFNNVNTPEEKTMIARCKYTVRKTFPLPAGWSSTPDKFFDYEILEAEAIQDDSEGKKTGEDLMKEAIVLCRSNTAAAAAARKAAANAGVK